MRRATRTRSASSSGDIDLKRYHSQELMQQEKEGSKILLQGGAQVSALSPTNRLESPAFPTLYNLSTNQCLQVVSQPLYTLNSGNKIPLIGLGTFKSTDEVMDEAVAAALRCGVRHVDCVSPHSHTAHQHTRRANNLSRTFPQPSTPSSTHHRTSRLGEALP